MASCPPTLLTVPKLDSCLPMPLHSFTWHFNIPQDGTVDLTSPTGSLRQSLPGQECNQTVLLRMAESDGFPVGDFCYKGAIQKVQVHTNVSVTATAQDFRRTRGPFLNVSFSQEIPGSVHECSRLQLTCRLLSHLIDQSFIGNIVYNSTNSKIFRFLS